MTKKNIVPFIGIAGALMLAALVVFAGSQDGTTVGGLSVFALCAIVAFALQWLAFVPAYLLRTEKFFDLTGSLTYLTVVALALAAAGTADGRSLILASLIVIWAVRLGTFLFVRILEAGRDRRFDAMRRHFPSFLLTWTLQGLWVFLTSSAALAAISTDKPAAMDWTAFVGVALWAAGFAIEVIADAQKQRFRRDPANEGRFIQSGLWARSRHPNYFGEILLWVGVAVVAAPSLSGWQWVTMASPVFVAILLTRVSGIPLLERRAKQRWATDQEYQAYVASTPVLVPRPWGRTERRVSHRLPTSPGER